VPANKILSCQTRRKAAFGGPIVARCLTSKRPANRDFLRRLVAGRTNKNGSAGPRRSFVAWSGETSLSRKRSPGLSPRTHSFRFLARSRVRFVVIADPQARDRLAV
jgi:hypothetical protein